MKKVRRTLNTLKDSGKGRERKKVRRTLSTTTDHGNGRDENKPEWKGPLIQPLITKNKEDMGKCGGKGLDTSTDY